MLITIEAERSCGFDGGNGLLRTGVQPQSETVKEVRQQICAYCVPLTKWTYGCELLKAAIRSTRLGANPAPLQLAIGAEEHHRTPYRKMKSLSSERR